MKLVLKSHRQQPADQSGKKCGESKNNNCHGFILSLDWRFAKEIKAYYTLLKNEVCRIVNKKGRLVDEASLHLHLHPAKRDSVNNNFY